MDTEYRQLSAADVLSLRDRVQELWQATDGVLSLGTACSGTDVLIRVVGLHLRKWKALFNFCFRIRHMFSCEIIDWKCRFIRDHWTPEAVFPDVTRLGNHKAQDIDGTWRVVPSPLLFACGIECDSVSKLNVNAHRHRACIEHGSDKTGSTAQGTIGFVKAHKPLSVILENVSSLGTKDSETGKSNLQMLVELFNGMGYAVWHSLVTAGKHGFPQSRERTYIVCVLEAPVAVNQYDKEFVFPRWHQGFSMRLAQLEVPTVHISRFLLPCDHPALRQWLQEKDLDAKKGRTKELPLPSQPTSTRGRPSIGRPLPQWAGVGPP